MHRKFYKLSLVAIPMLFVCLISPPALADQSAVDQISNAQGEIDRLNQQITTDQMLTFNLMRNIEQVSQRQQERNAEAQAETDPQRRQNVLFQIAGWNSWAGDAQMELNGYNEKIRTAQTRIASLQKQIEGLQMASIAEVVRATEQVSSSNSGNAQSNNTPVSNNTPASNNTPESNNTPASTPNPISALEQQNVVTQGQIAIDQNRTQQQIFDLNAVNFAIQALTPGSQTWSVLTNTKRALQAALDQTEQNIVKNKEILDAQTKIIENIKALNDVAKNANTSEVKNSLEQVSDVSSSIVDKIKENITQSEQINTSLKEIESTIAKLDSNDPTYVQLVASRNLLAATLKNFQDSSDKFANLQDTQAGLVSEAKEETVMNRAAAFLSGTAPSGSTNSSPNKLIFQRSKSGQYSAKVDISSAENSALSIESEEIQGMTVILKSAKGSYKVKLNASPGKNVTLTLPKKLASGSYQMSLSLPGKKPIAVQTKIQVK
jgi:hypothetical protein